MKFYATVGVQYGRNPLKSEIHPMLLTGRGYTEILAPDENTARQIMGTLTEGKWAFIYDRCPSPELYTNGVEMTVEALGDHGAYRVTSHYADEKGVNK